MVFILHYSLSFQIIIREAVFNSLFFLSNLTVAVAVAIIIIIIKYIFNRVMDI